MPKSKPKLTTAAYAARFEAEVERQQRRYCDAFARWRDCAEKACRRQRACRGDTPSRCLHRAMETVPLEAQRRARLELLKATPRNVGGSERIVRQCVPIDFYDGGASLRLRLVEEGR